MCYITIVSVVLYHYNIRMRDGVTWGLVWSKFVVIADQCSALLVRLQAHRSMSQPSRTRCMVSEVRLRDPKPLVNTIEPDSQMATGNYTLPPPPLKIHSDQAGEKWKRFRRAWDSYSLATGLSGKAENVHVATLLTTNLSLMYFPTLLMHALALHCVEYWKTCTMHFLLY